MDGFSTASDIGGDFEDYPKGWNIVPGIGMLCPKCSEKYNKLVEEFVAKEKTNE